MRVSTLTVVGVCGLFFGGWLIAAEAQDDEKELKKVEGVYVMLLGNESGDKLPDNVVKAASLIVTGKKHTVKVGDETIIGTHKVNASRMPKEIDSTDTEGLFKGKTYLGIYKVEKDADRGSVFTVYFAPPGKDRPKEFAVKTGEGEFLHVWKKK